MTAPVSMSAAHGPRTPEGDEEDWDLWGKESKHKFLLTPETEVE